jgi:hypothetical protein
MAGSNGCGRKGALKVLGGVRIKAAGMTGSGRVYKHTCDGPGRTYCTLTGPMARLHVRPCCELNDRVPELRRERVPCPREV